MTSRDFNSTNATPSTINRMILRAKYQAEAHPENGGLGENMIKDTNFLERVHYGVIDHENNSVIPNESSLDYVGNARLFNFVADSYSLMKLNFSNALQKGLVDTAGSIYQNLSITKAYNDPKVKYGRYLESIFQYYNKTHIPNIVGTTSIASYEDYVKHFFKFFFENSTSFKLSMTGWNTSRQSSILDTGLAFSISDLGFDQDQDKIDMAIDHPCFGYIKNLTMNFSFSILHNNPNIILYDVASPAGESIRRSYGLNILNSVFDKNYIKTYTIDNSLLYYNINIYFNKYVSENSLIKVLSVKNCKTVSEYFRLDTKDLNHRPYSDLEELWMYCKIRNKEEGSPYTMQKLESIYRKSKYYLKKVDKASGMSYINNMFRDQVWNKDYGFHDRLELFKGQTRTEAQRQQTGGGPSSGGSSY